MKFEKEPNLFVKTTEEKTDLLKNNKNKKEHNDDAETTKVEEEKTIEKRHFSNFLDSAKKLTFIFNKRNQESLTLLIEDQKLGSIKSAIANVENLISQKNFDLSVLNSEIMKIILAISSIKILDRRSGIREDVENLNLLVSALKNLGKYSNGLIKIMGVLEVKESDETKKYFHKLDKECQDRLIFVAGLRRALS